MPSAHRNVTVVAAFVTLFASVSPCVGCASGSDSAGTTALASTSDADRSTTSSDDTAEDTAEETVVEGSAAPSSTQDPSAPTTDAPVEVSDVRKALGDRDACALYEQMESMSFDQDEPAEFAAQLTEFAEVMDDAVDLVDPELHDDWALLADGAREMASQLRAHPDDRKKAAAVLSRPELSAASDHIDEWMDENCA